MSEKKKKVGFDGTEKTDLGGVGQNIKYWEATSPELEKLKARVMAKASPEAIAFLDPLNYKGPSVICDANDLTPEEWLAQRRNSIGSSEVCKVFGDSPYPESTNLDLYYSKLGIAPLIKKEQENKQAIFDWGHCMEAYIRLRAKEWWGETCEVIIDTNIYANPSYPFLTSNLDGLIKMPDGTWMHLEIKTTSDFNTEYKGGHIPIQYKRQLIQCQNIMGLWKSRLVVLHGRDIVMANNKFTVIDYERDLDEEYEQIVGVSDFWENHVKKGIPPQTILGPAKELLPAVRRYTGYGDKSLSDINIQDKLSELEEFFDIGEQIAALKKRIEYFEEMKAEIAASIALDMGQHEMGIAESETDIFYLSYKEKKGSKSCNYKKLESDFPDAFNACVKEGSPTRTMSLKKKPKK